MGAEVLIAAALAVKECGALAFGQIRRRLKQLFHAMKVDFAQNGLNCDTLTGHGPSLRLATQGGP